MQLIVTLNKILKISPTVKRKSQKHFQKTSNETIKLDSIWIFQINDNQNKQQQIISSTYQL